MTNEQINTAIAEACGEVHLDNPSDYCQCLNAMHEAEEQCLCGNQFNAYALMLDGINGSLFGIRATARQRAEMLLRLLGKWEDKK